MRLAAYASGTVEDRRAAHLALADATDPEVESERRVWHLAAAAAGPDEVVASELERTAVRAQARAGLAAAAAFLERSVQLTAEPARRVGRALAAAHAHLHAGSFATALGLLAEARALAADDVQRGQFERLRGKVLYASNARSEAPILLMRAAKTLEPLDSNLAREAYLDAWMASHAQGGRLLREVSRAARSASPSRNAATPCDLFLDGLATMVAEEFTAAAPSLRRALDVFVSEEVSDRDLLQWGHVATHTASLLWDWRSWEILSARHVELARVSGALDSRAKFAAWCGDFDAASALLVERDAVNEVMGIELHSTGGFLLAAYHGRPAAVPLLAAGAAECLERGFRQDAWYARWATAILCNGLGRYADAMTAAEQAASQLETSIGAGWALAELVEAAVRNRHPDVARKAMEQLPSCTLDDSDWASGIKARCRALVTAACDAERWCVEAVERLARTPFRTELARAHLVYGEWLRCEGRRVDARQQLLSARELFAAIGADGFEERARRELLATGEKVLQRNRNAETHTKLTPQEEQIARFARGGRTNAEIGVELFLSGRTVEWHLHKVFMKLGVNSRKDLEYTLSHGRPADRNRGVAEPSRFSSPRLGELRLQVR